jgi:hypothetical protein
MKVSELIRMKREDNRKSESSGSDSQAERKGLVVECHVRHIKR